MQSFTLGNHTDVGLRRQANEDYYGNWPVAGGHLFVVCDGMGGHVGGATAARLAVERIHEYFARQSVSNPIISLQKALEAANAAILQRKEKEPELEGMGTTAVVAFVWRDKLYYAHIGDSRIYLSNAGGLKRLTKDHSFVQTLVDNGSITNAEAEQHQRKNEIYKALGIQLAVEADVCIEPLVAQAGDTVLLCTDGLTGMVSEAAIQQTLQGVESIQQKAFSLIKQANDAGGVDNSTVQLIQFGNEVKPVKKRGLWWLLLLPVLAIGGWLAYEHFTTPAVVVPPVDTVVKDTTNLAPLVDSATLAADAIQAKKTADSLRLHRDTTNGANKALPTAKKPGDGQAATHKTPVTNHNKQH